MENESSVVRLRRKLSELSREYSTEKTNQSRSRSVNGRTNSIDSNGSFRYRRMRRKVENLRTQIDSFMQENPLIPDEHNDEKTTKNSMKTMIPTRDTDDLPMKKKNFNSDEQNLVTIELVQVLHSKQSRIDELEKRLKDVEEQESQWRKKYEQEVNRCETLQNRIVQLEEELVHRKQQSKILGQLQIDVKRLHSAFTALEVENTHLHNQLSVVRSSSSVTIPN